MTNLRKEERLFDQISLDDERNQQVGPAKQTRRPYERPTNRAGRPSRQAEQAIDA
jgi:hypothetical protein